MTSGAETLRTVFEALNVPKGTMRNIIEEASLLSGRQVEEIIRYDRHKEIAQIRHMCFWAARKAGFTFGEIGQYFKRHHTTIIHGVNQIEELMAAQSVEAAQ